MASKWSHWVVRRYRCDRCRRPFTRRVMADPLAPDRDHLDAHYCGRKDCTDPFKAKLFDVEILSAMEDYNASENPP